MEGEGKAFRVLGFNQSQRAQFVQILMSYGTMFLLHISEDITDAATFSDGVQKEGLRIEDVLVSYGTLLRVVLKYGYGRWQAIIDDKDSRVQESPLDCPGDFIYILVLQKVLC